MADTKNKANFSTPEVRNKVLETARTYFQSVLSDFNADIRQRKINGTLPSVEDIEGVERKIAEARADLHDFDFREPTKALSRTLYAEKFGDLHAIVDDQDVNVALCEYLTRARMTATKLYLERLKGKVVGTLVAGDDVFKGLDLDILPAQEITEEATKALTAMTAGESLDTALEAYIAHKEAKDRNEKTIRDIRTSMGLFKFILPNITGVKEITKANIVEFETKLAHIPAGYSRLKAIKDLPYEALLIACKGMEPFAGATYNKHAITLRAFVGWCQETDRMDNFKLPSFESKNKGSQKDKRDSFTDDDLVTLFTSPQYTGHKPDTKKGSKHRHIKGGSIIRDSYYWMPLVAMYSGMRLNEMAQLETADIKTEDGVQYFDVTDEGDDPKKSVKNNASKRKVPIHPMLFELGFGDFLKQVTPTVLSLILTWSEGKPMWQRDALRRILTTGNPQETDIAELVSLLKAEKLGPASLVTPIPLDEAHLPANPGATESLALHSISAVTGVNQLAADQILAFAPQGLTIVYGDNGAGKSGYVRILKRACRARHLTPIIPDAYNTARIAPTATISCSSGAVAPVPIAWQDSGWPHATLSAAYVFDRDCGAVHVRGENEVAFRPFGLDLPDTLAAVCQKVKAALVAEETALKTARNPIFGRGG